jgi:hypothetical protein
MTDQDIIEAFDTYYNDAYRAWDAYFPEAERDLRFYLGDQWDEQEKRLLFQEGRNAFVFNRVRRNINMITGYQRKHRLSSVVVPIENSDQQTADQFTQLLLYSMNYGEGYQTISDCFGGALKTGFNLMSVWMDYREDPINGDVKFGRDPYNGFILDPYFTKLDLSDCGYIIRRKYLNPEQVMSMLPGREKEIMNLYRVGWERDDKFTWLPYQQQPGGQELMAYNEFYQQKWRDVPVLLDMETGEFMDFDVPRERQELMLSLHENLKIIKKTQKYIERHVIVNDVLMKSDENPYGLNEYPFVPFVGIFEPESSEWELKMQSLIRCMRDPQREANRRRSQMIDILDSQINSGWIANENSVINPRSLFQSSQGKVIWKREDAPPGAIEKIPPAQIPPSMFQLQELFDRDIMEIAGVNDASFGSPDSGNESGIMMMLRQGAALVNIQDTFDNLRFAQKQLSRKVLKILQTWTPEKVKRIINDKPTQQFYKKEFTKYDIDVTEGMLTDTQKQMYFRQLVDLKQLGAPVTGEMLAEAAPIQGKTSYIKQISQMEKQQAAQAQESQKVQEQLLDSQRQMAQAKAISDIALSKERFTRSVANMGLEDERASKAVQDRSDAALSRVKAMKELEAMDSAQLLKYLTIIRSMETMNQVKEEQIKSDDVTISGAAASGQTQLENPMGQQGPIEEQQTGEVSDEETRI